MGYSIMLAGNCMGDVFPGGSKFNVDPLLEIPLLGLCHVVFRPDTDWGRQLRESWPELQNDDPVSITKLFLDRGMRGGREVIMLGQLKPASIAIVPVADAIALHRIVAEAKPCEVARIVELLAWACGTDASPPINPDWKPPATGAAAGEERIGEATVQHDYYTEATGDCLGVALPPGTRIVADTTKPITPGDVVNLVLRPGKGLLDRYFGDVPRPICLGKIYIGTHRTAEGSEVVSVGQLYPPTACLVGIEEIEAMHKVACSGVVNLCARPEEMEAFKMLAPFLTNSVRRPINSEWRPAAQRDAA